MTLNYGWYDLAKYQFKWLRVFWLCERNWVRVLCMLTFVLLFYYLNYEVMFWYDMMSELDMLSMKHELT